MSRNGWRHARMAPGIVALVVVALCLYGRLARAEVRFSEIMYNPPEGGDFEFLELHNDGEAAVDLTGWQLVGGVGYVFEAGTVLPAGSWLVVAEDVGDFLLAYSDVPREQIVGPFRGRLSDVGEQIGLVDASGETVEAMVFGDALPWDWLADGYGASLERVCFDSPASDPATWRAGVVPETVPSFGGTPAAANSATSCPPAELPRPRVLISEVHYHAVLEESLEDAHEFIEIHNATDAAVDLGGWRLVGGIDYAFAPGASIEAGGYRVIAKSPERLAALEAYGLTPAEVWGPYARELDNGGERVALVGSEGQGIDFVRYDDEFPWPIGADALGAGENWLDPAILPLEQHRHLGISLERVSFDTPSSEIANWAPSPLDGATPGRANASARAEPLPVVADLLVQAENVDAEDRLIRSDDRVRAQVLFSPAPPVGVVRLEHFVDELGVEDEERFFTILVDDGTSGDLVPGDGVFSGLLQAHEDNTIVRYRVLADRGAGEELVSPRPSDPMAWHAYFVTPEIETDTGIYHLFVDPVEWTRLWSNVTPGRASGCTENPRWNDRVYAVVVWEGEVHDCRVRYQGSRWNRTNGPNISNWPFPGPSLPRPVRALSWRISLPRYARYDGKNEITLNKLTQGCPGYNAGVGYELFRRAGVPASRTWFRRLHINGGYYHYMMEYERPGEEMMERWHRLEARATPHLPREPVGHLHKSIGCNCDEGPYGWGDHRLLPARCGYTELDRYAATYPRKTHEWADSSNLRDLIVGLHEARRGGVAELRVFFEERFDVDLLLDHIAIINWSVPFDDMFQNHFLYQRRSDGRWLLMPWDLDRNFGEWQGANSSIYMGEQGNPSNRSGWWNYIKDSFLEAFRDEFDDRLFELNNTLLHPDNVAAIVDEVTAQSNPEEAARAPAGVQCSFPARATSFKAFARQRHDYVNRSIAAVAVDAGDDQTVFVGEEVRFDGSASTPPESEEVLYTWSNGMAGATPSFVFDEPGDYELTLTVTVRGVGFDDSVRVTVLPIPATAFVERDGLVSMEAESFWMNAINQGEDTFWEERGEQAGHSGDAYMHAVEIERETFLSRYVGQAPELRFAILFESAGPVRVWLRGFVPTSRSDSLHVTLDGVERSSNEAHEFQVDELAFTWSGLTRRDEPQILEVPSPGLHWVSLFVRESGISIDKIVLSRDLDTAPEGEGPPESPIGPVGGGAEPFVRGDVNGNERLEIADASDILLWLFAGEDRVDCEDHADVDDDGTVQINDAIRLLDFLFQAGPRPEAPYPEPGYDPTPDDFPCGDL